MGKIKTRITLICKQCEKEFKVSSCFKSRKFCSKGCYLNYLKISKNNPMYGKVSWNNGKTIETDERIKKLGRKISKVLTGHSCSEETKRKISKSEKGKIIPIDVRKSQSLRMKGKNNTFYNKHHTIITRKQISISKGGNGSLDRSDYPIEFYYSEFRNKVKNRDNYLCVGCSISEAEELILRKKKLAIHHIDTQKENLDLSNLMTLCNSCHSILHNNLVLDNNASVIIEEVI